MRHIDNIGNVALLASKQQSVNSFQHAFVSKHFVDMCTISGESKESTVAFYLYNNDSNQISKLASLREPNLVGSFIIEMESYLKLEFSKEKHSDPRTFAPIDILDYLYGVLHSPAYRDKYKEFLKIDFPRVPYPKDASSFWKLVNIGGQIRQIHLLESPKVEDYVTTYPIGGSNTITTKVGKKDWDLYDADNGIGRIWINEEQYFDKIPLVAWEFYIGGHQPAQKWLKDRKQRTLEFDDILHYQKIIVALVETDRLMKEVDEVGVE